jgi:hypothetical protein
MQRDVEIFSFNEVLPESAWLHGRATGAGWLTGSLNLDDQVDVSLELDAAVAGAVGAEIAKALASLDIEASAAGHAGMRMVIATPLDLFTGAGLMANVKMEASLAAAVQVRVRLSLAVLLDTVMRGIPPEMQRYARIVLEDCSISAGVSARGTFAAMVVNQLLVTASLFPTDGSLPGISVFSRYGYSWGFGGEWGIVVNLGFAPQRTIDRLGEELAQDLTTFIRAYRDAENVDPNSVLSEVLGAGEAILPSVLGVLLRIGYGSASSGGNTRTSLRKECSTGLQKILRNALASGLAEICAGALRKFDVKMLSEDRIQQVWADINIAMVGLSTEDPPSLDTVVDAARLLSGITDFMAPAAGAPVRSALRCATSLAVLIAGSDAKVNRTRLAGVLGRGQAGDGPLDMAAAVLTNELADLAAKMAIMPFWISQLVGDVSTVLPLLVHDRDTNAASDTTVLSKILGQILEDLLHQGPGQAIMKQFSADTRSSLSAAAEMLRQFCLDLSTGLPNLKKYREGLSVCVLTLIGEPVTKVFNTVIDQGLRCAPPAFRELANELEAAAAPVGIASSWDQLGRAAVGVSLGQPTAALLRRSATKVENWCGLVLPEELEFLTRSMKLAAVCDSMVANGLQQGLAEHKANFRAAFAAHCVDHVVKTTIFTVVDSAGLLPDAVKFAVDSIVSELNLIAVAAFKAFEESVERSVKAANDLKARVDELEKDVAAAVGAFLARLGEIAQTAQNMKATLGHHVVDWLQSNAMAGAAGSGIDRNTLATIIAEVLNALSGGVVMAIGSAVERLAATLTFVGESLLRSAESGPAIGIQALASRYWAPGNIATVRIPIVIEVPNPIAPFILPPIKVEICRVDVPGQLIGDAALTILMDGLGIGALLAGLDATVNSLKLTRIAIAQVKEMLKGSDGDSQKAALELARAHGPLSIEVVSPTPNSATAPAGEIEFLVRGANMSFAFPADSGLPASMPPRVKVLVNGRDLTQSLTHWDEVVPNTLRGRVSYTTSGGSPRDRTVFVRGPVAVVIVVVGGDAHPGASTSWQFVPRSELSDVLIVTHAKKDSTDVGRCIDALGGLTSAGKPWRFSLGDALALHRQGTAFAVLSPRGVMVHLQVVYGSSGRPYFRTPAGRGGPTLGSLPHLA